MKYSDVSWISWAYFITLMTGITLGRFMLGNDQFLVMGATVVAAQILSISLINDRKAADKGAA